MNTEWGLAAASFAAAFFGTLIVLRLIAWLKVRRFRLAWENLHRGPRPNCWRVPEAEAKTPMDAIWQAKINGLPELGTQREDGTKLASYEACMETPYTWTVTANYKREKT